MTFSSSRAETALMIQRVLLSFIIAAHGWARWIFDAVEPFGIWLDGQGFPLGVVIAYTVTLIEVLGTPLLAIGRFVLPLCIIYSVIYTMGIVLVHAPEGWFVVGLGRNGMEYSVLLIVCLLSVAYQFLPNKQSR